MPPKASNEPFAVGGGAMMLRCQYLAGFNNPHYATVPSTAVDSPPTHEGCLEDLEKKFPELKPVLWNDVKVCECGKPCAFTLTACNGCGRSLVDTPLTKSENVFAAFLFGVKLAKRGFPYKISIRRQTPDVLVFDDMLALTPCHLNAIPTKYHIPDWRHLLKNPKLGLKILDQLEMELWAATMEFVRNSDWKKTVMRADISDEELWGKVIKSFNFPPSQFQLHVQWLVPPLVPFQHYVAEIRNHFHQDRAFSMEYVRHVLSLNEPYDVHDNTPIEEIVAHYDSRGVNYTEHWEAFYNAALRDSIDLCNWMPKDFDYVVEDSKVYKMELDAQGIVQKGALVPDANTIDIQKRDCAALQNYGRPYTDNKPGGTYIQYAVKPFIGPGGLEPFPRC